MMFKPRTVHENFLVDHKH